MKVIAFNGSARKDGNTAILINNAFKEIKKEGINCEMIQLADTKIRGCKACYTCFENKDKYCLIKDRNLFEEDGTLKLSKTERMKLYADRNTQVFLSKFLSDETSTLEPAYDPETGYRYKIVEAIVGTASEAEAFLTKLYEVGILERSLYDRIIHCPKCGSTNNSIHWPS